MYCKKCGNRLDDDAVFCSVCGMPIKKRTDPEPGRKKPGRSRAALLIGSVASVLILAIAAGGVVWFIQEKRKSEISENRQAAGVSTENEENKQITNTEKGLARKMSALRSFYGYFYKRQAIAKNPTLLVDMPKLHEKAIIRLDADEVARLLDYVDHGGDDLTGQRKVYFEKTKNRDLAILTLLLGTGIRVSECVGLDIQDVDFKNNGIKVTRKGGNEMIVYFGEEVANALKTYLYTTRKSTVPLSGHENALFLSTQRRRMGVQAVENMVRKYAREVTPNKKITPHKLRSTYGTALYKETGDIYLVADVLGHKDVNTTKKHYAAIDEDRRRQAAGAVKLREV